MPFTVKTQTFEGPLDLLLDLIEKRKLFINDISLAKVTDDFIEHVRRFDNLPIADSAHFILIASTLLLIKSKSLLPELPLSEEEQGNIHDLETRLKIYKKIKEASLHISSIFGQQMIFAPAQARTRQIIFMPDPEFNINKALECLNDLIKRLPKKEALPKALVRKVISLEEMIGTLTTRITKTLRLSFKEFSGEHRGNRVNVIVSFLAMLEMVKTGILHASQDSAFGDIQMETKEVGVPRY